MFSYFLRRLAPLYVFALVIEILFTIPIIARSSHEMDWSLPVLIETFGVLLLTTTIAFIYMMIPYLLYLLFLPQRKQNTRFDRIFTTVLYTLFVYISLFEETASQIFWDEFKAAFNFIAVDYLVYTHEVVANIYQSYPIVWILAAIFGACGLIVFFTRKYLFTPVEAPSFRRRLAFFAGWIALCFGCYSAIDISELEVNKNSYNNEISKEGTYSLFSAFLKNSIAYDRFYITEEDSENLKILRDKLGGKNIKFLNDKNIARNITSNRAEQRRNVVIVLMESMSAKYMDENRPTASKTITPNLTRLSQEGLYFPNTYASGTRSVRGIEALNLSVPPLPGMSIVRRPGNENLHGLGAIFKDKGYDNKWIYGGYGYFDNMNYFFSHNGFQVVDRNAWADSEVTFDNAWGAADEDTYNKLIGEADKSYAAGKPFLTFVLSISNHRPFTYPEGKIDLPSGVSRREGGVKYADYAIGQLVKNAQNRPWFKNTVFVFIADHTAGAAGNEEINLEGHHIPFIIYAPGFVRPLRIETPISQADALPTLLGLLNFDYESRFYGQDALSPDYESRYFVSNYQKIGYVKNGVDVILKPVKQFSVEPENAADGIIKANLREAVAFYQQASDWQNNLKE